MAGICVIRCAINKNNYLQLEYVTKLQGGARKQYSLLVVCIHCAIVDVLNMQMKA